MYVRGWSCCSWAAGPAGLQGIGRFPSRLGIWCSVALNSSDCNTQAIPPSCFRFVTRRECRLQNASYAAVNRYNVVHATGSDTQTDLLLNASRDTAEFYGQSHRPGGRQRPAPSYRSKPSVLRYTRSQINSAVLCSLIAWRERMSDLFK